VHSHAGWEIVLVVSGELRYVLDGERAAAMSGRFLELPAGSVHAIWAPGEVVFDVIGQQGLGLTIVVPDGGGGMRRVPVYLPDGPWAQELPAGATYTPVDELERLRRASLALR
jgi:Cupin domain